MAKVRIIDEYDALSTDPHRMGQLDTVLVYMMDSRGPYYSYHPKEQFSFDQAMQEIRRKEQERSKHVGREIEV